MFNSKQQNGTLPETKLFEKKLSELTSLSLLLLSPFWLGSASGIRVFQNIKIVVENKSVTIRYGCAIGKYINGIGFRSFHALTGNI